MLVWLAGVVEAHTNTHYRHIIVTYIQCLTWYSTCFFINLHDYNHVFNIVPVNSSRVQAYDGMFMPWSILYK